jgi:hypothetical protein
MAESPKGHGPPSPAETVPDSESGSEVAAAPVVASGLLHRGPAFAATLVRLASPGPVGKRKKSQPAEAGPEA